MACAALAASACSGLCYSPSALSENGTAYTGGPQFCSEDAALREVMGICNGSSVGASMRC